MDFLISHSPIVKELNENDNNLTANMLLPLDKQDAVTEFMDYVDILVDLMNEPNEGVWKLMRGCAPYDCLQYLNEREHNNLLFIIDYFLLPNSLKTRVTLSLTRDAYACFEDLSDFTKKDIEFWVIVGEKIGIDRILSNTCALTACLKGLLISSKIRSKLWFDYLMPTKHSEVMYIRDQLWETIDSNLIQWILDDKFIRPPIHTIICNYFITMFHIEKDSDDIPEIVKIIILLFQANKKFCEEINVKIVFIKALYAGNTTLLDYIYEEFHPDIAEDEQNYFQTAMRGCGGGFVWLCRRYTSTIQVDVLKRAIFERMHHEDVLYFHENIQPLTEAEIIEGFKSHLDSEHKRIPIFETVKYFISLGFNLLHINIVNDAIENHDYETLKLLHKLGYKFRISSLKYALRAYNSFNFCETVFLLIHKYMNYCKIPETITKQLLHNNKEAKIYFKKCAKLRAGLCASL